MSQRPNIAPHATRMYEEAQQASEVVRRQLAANTELMTKLGQRLRDMQPRAVVTVGRGSSDHAATFAQYLIETRLGVLTSSAAPSVSSLYRATPDMTGAVCLAISQSGQSPDLLTAVEGAKAAGAFVVALVNAPNSPLAHCADRVVPLHGGPEVSVAATKSYIASLSALVHLTAAWARDVEIEAALRTLPEQLAQAFALDWRAMVPSLTEAANLYVVGRGLGFAAAQEIALKFKETCGLHAEAFSAAEVRHGPMALVGPGFPVMALAQDDQSREGVDALVQEFLERGAQIFLARGGPGPDLPSIMLLPALEAHPVLQPILYVQSAYRMINELSLARGFDPDRPPHLNKVTETL